MGKFDKLLWAKNLVMIFYPPPRLIDLFMSKNTNALAMNVLNAVCNQKAVFIHILKMVLMELPDSKQSQNVTLCIF